MRHQRYSLASIIAAVMALGVGYARGEATNAASLVCLQAKYDFGSVYPDAEIRCGFVLTNRGSRVVKIMDVHATCGCTKASAAASEVAAGAKTDVNVELDFKGRRGHLVKSIYVETDDPGNQVLRLEVEGIVMQPIDVQPEGLHFGTVGVDGKVEREVLLTATGTNVFHVRSVTTSSSQLSAVCELLEEGRRYRVKISSEGPRNYGSAMVSVRVVTDNPRMETVDIPVAFFVAGDIVAAPAVLLVTPTPTNLVRTSRFTLWSPSAKPFKVTKVECPGDGMTAVVNAVMTDRIQVEVKTWGAQKGIDGKSLRIQTDLPTMKELLVPVRVLPAGGGEAVTNRP